MENQHIFSNEQCHFRQLQEIQNSSSYDQQSDYESYDIYSSNDLPIDQKHYAEQSTNQESGHQSIYQRLYIFSDQINGKDTEHYSYFQQMQQLKKLFCFGICLKQSYNQPIQTQQSSDMNIGNIQIYLDNSSLNQNRQIQPHNSSKNQTLPKPKPTPKLIREKQVKAYHISAGISQISKLIYFKVRDQKKITNKKILQWVLEQIIGDKQIKGDTKIIKTIEERIKLVLNILVQSLILQNQDRSIIYPRKKLRHQNKVKHLKEIKGRFEKDKERALIKLENKKMELITKKKNLQKMKKINKKIRHKLQQRARQIRLYQKARALEMLAQNHQQAGLKEQQTVQLDEENKTIDQQQKLLN